MISEKYRTLFVHVPKVAGMSIEKLFLDLHGLSWKDRSRLLLQHNENLEIGPDELSHLTAEEYVECGHISERNFNLYFKFAFVRNPWSRLVSSYRFRNTHRKYSFRDFVICKLPEIVENPNTRLNLHRHYMPQYNYLYDRDGTCLVDFVGKFENLQNDFDAVCQKINIANSSLPRVNSKDGVKRKLKDVLKTLTVGGTKEPVFHKKYTCYYDKELQETVGSIYAKDISTFDYKFGG
jgi:hypothetical protein